MSEQTKEALEDAIEAHIASESVGKLPGGYALIVETVDLDDIYGTGTYRLETRTGQSPFLTAGLINAALYADRIDAREE